MISVAFYLLYLGLVSGVTLFPLVLSSAGLGCAVAVFGRRSTTACFCIAVSIPMR